MSGWRGLRTVYILLSEQDVPLAAFIEENEAERLREHGEWVAEVQLDPDDFLRDRIQSEARTVS